MICTQDALRGPPNEDGVPRWLQGQVRRRSFFCFALRCKQFLKHGSKLSVYCFRAGSLMIVELRHLIMFVADISWNVVQNCIKKPREFDLCGCFWREFLADVDWCPEFGEGICLIRQHPILC